MTRLELIVGLVSLLPAAVNAQPGQHHDSLAVRLCTGDGAARTIQLPVGRGELPGGSPAGCCAKGCHTGGTRRRERRRLDPSQ